MKEEKTVKKEGKITLNKEVNNIQEKDNRILETKIVIPKEEAQVKMSIKGILFSMDHLVQDRHLRTAIQIQAAKIWTHKTLISNQKEKVELNTKEGFTTKICIKTILGKDKDSSLNKIVMKKKHIDQQGFTQAILIREMKEAI